MITLQAAGLPNRIAAHCSRWGRADSLIWLSLMGSLTAGGMVARNRYYPQGGVRTQWGMMPTDKLFTGQQRESADIYDYGARMYNTDLGRMPQADPLAPDPFNPQSYNAYSGACPERSEG
jgi:RHS repeat-associated protein